MENSAISIETQMCNKHIKFVLKVEQVAVSIPICGNNNTGLEFTADVVRTDVQLWGIFWMENSNDNKPSEQTRSVMDKVIENLVS